MSRTESTNIIVAKALQSIREDNPVFYNVNRTQFTATVQAKNFFELKLAALSKEVFEVAFLDNQHKLIKSETMFTGSISSASVYPREIAKRSLELNAASVILAHNHPSGLSVPSNQDKSITSHISSMLKLLEVSVLDHIIVGNETYSFGENGLL